VTFVRRQLLVWYCAACEVKWAEPVMRCWCCGHDEDVIEAIDECVPGGILELVDACAPAQMVRVRM